MFHSLLMSILHVMAPQGRKVGNPAANQSRVAKGASKFYSETVPDADKSTMQDVKEEVHLVYEFDEKEVEDQNSEFFRTSHIGTLLAYKYIGSFGVAKRIHGIS
jgi:hypothetical protein